MRYWWVNQNQTFRQEIAGGYLWSPKRNANGARNPFYESMREVSPGDLIFSLRRYSGCGCRNRQVPIVGSARNQLNLVLWPELGKCRMESERIVYSTAEQDPPQGSHGRLREVYRIAIHHSSLTETESSQST